MHQPTISWFMRRKIKRTLMTDLSFYLFFHRVSRCSQSYPSNPVKSPESFVSETVFLSRMQVRALSVGSGCIKTGSGFIIIFHLHFFSIILIKYISNIYIFISSNSQTVNDDDDKLFWMRDLSSGKNHKR